MSFLKEIPQLIKYKISFAVTYTTVAGFVLYHKGFHIHLLLICSGVFLLSAGAMAINQLQEEKFDAIMKRTSGRPLPGGRMTKIQVVLTAIVFFLAGSTILFIHFPIITLALGIFNVVWYNAVYTPLKRLTPLAVIPGSLIGAVPAMMGWVAAGGNVFDVRIIALSLFLIIWQIPHFWLIMFRNNNEYEQAGFPGIERLFSQKNIKHIIFAWMLATTCSAMLLAIFGLISNSVLIVALILVNVFLIILFYKFVSNQKTVKMRFVMIGINLYMLIILSLSMINVFLGHTS